MKRTRATNRQLRTLDDADLARVNGGEYVTDGGDGGSGDLAWTYTPGGRITEPTIPDIGWDSYFWV
jgi:hypothetical protein